MHSAHYSLSLRDICNMRNERTANIRNTIRTYCVRRFAMENKANITSIVRRPRTRDGIGTSRGATIALGSAIRLCRNARGATLLDLAKGSGFSASYLAKCERGEVDVPYDTLAVICESLDIPVYLVTYLAQPGSDENSVMDRNMAHAALVCLKGIKQSKRPSLTNEATKRVALETSSKPKGRKRAH